MRGYLYIYVIYILLYIYKECLLSLIKIRLVTRFCLHRECLPIKKPGTLKQKCWSENRNLIDHRGCPDRYLEYIPGAREEGVRLLGSTYIVFIKDVIRVVNFFFESGQIVML
jgi:hypothetical protein